MRKVAISVATAFLLIGGLSWLLLRQGGGGDDGGQEAAVPAVLTKSPRQRTQAPVDLARGEDAAKAAPATAAPGSEVKAGVPLLSGRILELGELPIPGARVEVRTSEEGRGGFESVLRARVVGRPAEVGRVLGEAVSGADGSYAVLFAPVPDPGDYRVEVRRSGFIPQEETWHFDGTPSTLDVFLDGGGETIAGVVVDPGGQPIAGATVEAERDDGDDGDRRRFRGPGMGRGSADDRATTAEDGSFSLVVAPGRYDVSARAQSYQRARAEGIEAGVQDLRLELEAAPALAGRVLDEAGNPIGQAQVAIYPQDERWGGRWNQENPESAVSVIASRVRRLFQEPAARAESGEDGTFRLVDLSLKGYLLDVRRSGFEVGQRPGTLPEEGEPAAVEVRLKPGAILTGTVLDAAGAPVAGVLVAVGDEGGREREGGREGRGFRGRERGGEDGRGGRGEEGRGGQAEAAGGPRRGGFFSSIFRSDFATETDLQGRFRFDTLARSVYTLSVQSEKHVPYTQGALQVEQETDVKVSLDSGLMLSGRVLSRVGGEGVPRATVRLGTRDPRDALLARDGRGEGERRSVQADAEGRYEISGLSPGRLGEIRVSARGFTTAFAEELELQPSPREQSYDFEIDPAATLSGTVLGSGGEPVPRARLRVASVQGENPGPGAGGEGEAEAWREMRRRGDTEVRGQTRADGTFRIQGVNAGPAFRMIVTHPDYQELRSEPFAVAPGAQMEGLVYRLRAGGRITVTVLRPDGSPLANQRVEVRRERPQAESSDDRRRFALRGRGSEGGSRTTTAEGKARFGGLQAATYSVRVAAAGFQPFRQNGVGVFEDQAIEFTAQLLPENVISGVVTDTAGAAIARARVSASPAGQGERESFFQMGRGGGGAFGMGDGSSGRGASQPDGSFKLGSLGTGPYQVRVSAEGFADQRYESVEVNQALEVRLQRLGAIEGVVLSAETGMPFTRFSVQAQPEGRRSLSPRPQGESPAPPAEGGGDRSRTFRRGRSGGREGSREVQDAAGRFAIANLDPGSYVVQVRVPDLPPREVQAKVAEGATTPVQVLIYEGIVVAGLVFDQGSNLPLAGAEVSVIPAPEDPAQEETGGRARLERLSARRNGGGEEPQSQGRPRRSGRSVVEPVSTDESGAFALRNVPPGKYFLVANHPDFVIGQEPFGVHDEGLTRELRLSLATGEELRGTITEAAGTPAAGATVQVRSAEGLGKRVMADALGRYLVRGLVPGSHTVFVFSTGRPDRAQVEIKKGENRLDIRRAPRN